MGTGYLTGSRPVRPPWRDPESMKVLDLKCAQAHTFEGWFASEAEFQRQQSLGMIECPFCGQSKVVKQLSAPRLNLTRAPALSVAPSEAPVAGQSPAATVQALWMGAMRRVLADTVDVGHQFTDEARKMHYGDAPVRSIRGQASLAETKALVEEGIDVLPLLMPESLKQTLQ